MHFRACFTSSPATVCAGATVVMFGPGALSVNTYRRVAAQHVGDDRQSAPSFLRLGDEGLISMPAWCSGVL